MYAIGEAHAAEVKGIALRRLDKPAAQGGGNGCVVAPYGASIALGAGRIAQGLSLIHI